MRFNKKFKTIVIILIPIIIAMSIIICGIKSSNNSSNNQSLEEVKTTQLFDRYFMKFKDKLQQLTYQDISLYIKENDSIQGEYYARAKPPSEIAGRYGYINLYDVTDYVNSDYKYSYSDLDNIIEINKPDFIFFSFDHSGYLKEISYYNERNNKSIKISKSFKNSDVEYYTRGNTTGEYEQKVKNYETLVRHLFDR